MAPLRSFTGSMSLRGWLWSTMIVVGCSAPSASEPGTPPASSPRFEQPGLAHTSVSGPADASGIEVRVRASAWGSGGPVAVDGPRIAAVWLLEAVADTDHSGLALTSVSFFDDSGEPLADGLDLELRAAGPSTTDFARASTGDFDGRLPAGVPVRLWVAARMPKAVADATRPTPPSFQLVLTSEQPAIVRIAGPLGPQLPSG